MEYILGITILVIIIYGCLWSFKKRPRNKAKEFEDMLEGNENHYEKFRKKAGKDE